MNTRPKLPLAELSSEEQAVVAALEWGRENARLIPEAAAAAGLPPRRYQRTVEHLVHVHGIPIGTAMGPPHGNYLVDDPEELARVEELLRRRGISLIARAAALRRFGLRRYLSEIQTALDDEGGDA